MPPGSCQSPEAGRPAGRPSRGGSNPSKTGGGPAGTLPAMSDPQAQAETQLRNIEEATGMTLADFAESVAAAGVDRHGQIVAHLKEVHGLTHGNANLVAHRVREADAGGPASDDELLAAQYRGRKEPLLAIYHRVAEVARGFGDDVEQVVQKTGVSFRRDRQFALVQAPSARRVQLGLKLDHTPDDARVVETSGMCSHRVDLTGPEDLDDDVIGWLRLSYDQAG